MRVLDPIVEVLRAAMLDRCEQLAVGDLVAAEFVGDDHPRHVLQVFEQRAEESFGGHRISAGLDQNLEISGPTSRSAVAAMRSGAPPGCMRSTLTTRCAMWWVALR